MKILGIDSSASSASVAIMQEGKIIGEFYINTKLTHSQTLVPMIDALLKNTCTPLSQIDALAVNTGPGSFTGIRIGVCAVKGIAMAEDKKCICVSTLEAMAQNLSHLDCVVCAVMDARCNQVYNALFSCENQKAERLCEDRALPIDELKKEIECIQKPVYLVGDGAELCYKSFCDLKNVVLAPPALRFQKASGVCTVAINKYKNEETLSAEQLMPQYLRLPQAQRELKKRMEEKQ